MKTSILIWKYGTSIIVHTQLQTALVKFELASNLSFTQGILVWPNDISNRWHETWIMWVVTEDLVCIIWLFLVSVFSREEKRKEVEILDKTIHILKQKRKKLQWPIIW